ncbi:hypothetical protein N568_0112330 [Lactococcus garvieae TRF1]|uniref:Arsenate reductase n=1 Tax=Lactococcus garvieae TRF1 TaxID=1380772 RepID=V8AM83_9LACT|nr:hypothetical protein N568_0112330 [Lactococcus garvieae TRF1]
MLKIYTISSNQETKEAERWLYAHKVKFIEVDLLKELFRQSLQLHVQLGKQFGEFPQSKQKLGLTHV